MASSVSVFAAPARVDPRVHPPISRARPSGGAVAATLSIVIHLVIALLATRHFRGAAVTPERGEEPIERLTVDLEPLTTELEAQSKNGEAAPSPVPRTPAAAMRVVAQGALTRSVPAAVPPRLTQGERTTTTTSDSEPIPAASSAAESSAPRFTITVSTRAGSSSANPASTSVAGSNSPSPGTTADAPLSVASVDVPARLRAGNVPTYTPAALAAGIEANVPLEIVISERGLVTSARGLEHVGYGLDEAARQSVLGYRFTPAMRKNNPVQVRMRWLMRFQLR